MTNTTAVNSGSDNRVRTFDTGATRSADAGKHDYDGYFSPFVFRDFADYMTKHRIQQDGNVRPSDNWKKGIPRDKYIKSLWRHFMDLWLLHYGEDVYDLTDGYKITPEEACCAIEFNTMGYHHELLMNPLVEVKDSIYSDPITAPVEVLEKLPAPNKLKSLLTSMGLATK